MHKVLHAPIEIAGQVGLICEYLKKLGHHAVGYNYFQTYLNYEGSIIHTDLYQLQKLFDAALHHFNIFHFHNSYTFFSDFRDLPMLKDAGIKMVMHHRGNDVRFSDKARKGDSYSNPYAYTGSSFPDAAIHHNLQQFSKYMSAVIVQDYELYHYVKDYYPKVHVLPRLIDTDKLKPIYPHSDLKKPLIVHAPTDREFKGSEFIEKAISDLKEKYSFEYVRIENKSHEEAKRLYREADLVIDQIRCGAFGNVSVEAMALGKPVVAYIREDLVDTYPGKLPIVSANPDTIRRVLRRLIKNRDELHDIGRRGRKYVEKHHRADIVAKQLVDIYDSITD
ncbi:glycosyltransferase family 4 protein [Marinicrinis lubricantis]|uniref:Glycosyltransferase family 4 protein n=1 Tax=Marinicrinis lubricantis TaxID=2086470 RepID=A0ABW1IQQ2_9BACL